MQLAKLPDNANHRRNTWFDTPMHASLQRVMFITLLATINSLIAVVEWVSLVCGHSHFNALA
jgi:hypothetical protein